MKKQRFWGTALLFTCISLSMATLAWSDSDKWGDKDKYAGKSFEQKTSAASLVINKAYQNECSACHFAYQPGFLPERSWVKIMNTLDDHFGENAELDNETMAEITTYLRDNAGDQAPQRFSRSILRSIDDQAVPLRITETPYFRREHREIPNRMVKGNTKVRSFSNCLSCHAGAEKGSFNEHSVRIPGFGRWED